MGLALVCHRINFLLHWAMTFSPRQAAGISQRLALPVPSASWLLVGQDQRQSLKLSDL